MAQKVSVIIPNYNHADHLQQRIETVLDQTFRDFEVIILDDRSTDGSKEVIEKYRDHPAVTHVVYNDVNSGNPFLQWKKGIDLAKGEWIWIAESDDYADKHFLEKLLTELGDRKDVGLIYCDSYIVSGNTPAGSFAPIKNAKFGTDRWSKNHFNNGLSEIEGYLLPEGTINNSSAVLFNRKVLIEANPFDLNLRYIGDKYAFVKVLAQSDIVYVKDVLNYYRDPFNTKHADRFILYFYEQFLVFDWAYRNLRIKDKVKFFNGFHANTRNSLFRGWSKSKVAIYKKLFDRNPRLLIKSIVYNFLAPMVSIFKA